MGNVGGRTWDGGLVEFMGLMSGDIDSCVIGDCTFSRRRAESLHASVIDPPPRVRMLSALHMLARVPVSKLILCSTNLFGDRNCILIWRVLPHPVFYTGYGGREIVKISFPLR
jgi:hypothetical protein